MGVVLLLFAFRPVLTGRVKRSAAASMRLAMMLAMRPASSAPTMREGGSRKDRRSRLRQTMVRFSADRYPVFAAMSL